MAAATMMSKVATSCLVLAILFVFSASDDAKHHSKTCSGETVDLHFNTTEGDLFEEKITFQAFTATNASLLGTYIGDMKHFLAIPNAAHKVSYVHGTLTITNVTTNDTGNYTVTSTYQQGADGSDYIWLDVYSAPKVENGSLHVNLGNITYNQATLDNWRVQLSCGNFTDLGHPPLDVHSVLWEMPDGTTKHSDRRIHGIFYISLTYPVASGEYSCFINTTYAHLMQNCSGSNLPANGTWTADVDKVKLLYLETRLSAEHEFFMKEIASMRNDCSGNHSTTGTTVVSTQSSAPQASANATTVPPTPSPGK